MTAPRSGPAVATACWVSMTAASRSASRVSTRRVWRQPVTSRAEAMIPSAVGVTRTENQRLSGAKKPSNSTSVCSTNARNASAWKRDPTRPGITSQTERPTGSPRSGPSRRR